ncbi:hypothetical protein B0A55_02967 [Friedmanniomyces simplex]|uniref:Uncharacterized protein n=1 Tax=Friedmanniomyces simplex TaxID=329884 RepID=A0A4V5NIT3_9PEZI|nr:hypothetical protein B0A55_02967 [Friedmanniomyces simplex]
MATTIFSLLPATRQHIFVLTNPQLREDALQLWRGTNTFAIRYTPAPPHLFATSMPPALPPSFTNRAHILKGNGL